MWLPALLKLTSKSALTVNPVTLSAKHAAMLQIAVTPVTQAGSSITISATMAPVLKDLTQMLVIRTVSPALITAQPALALLPSALSVQALYLSITTSALQSALLKNTLLITYASPVRATV